MMEREQPDERKRENKMQNIACYVKEAARKAGNESLVEACEMLLARKPSGGLVGGKGLKAARARVTAAYNEMTANEEFAKTF